MLKRVTAITSEDYKDGLSTIPNIFALKKNQSPNMMNVRVNFDGSIQKRLGNTTTNSTEIAVAAALSFSSGSQALTNNLISWWKFNEVSDDRVDTYSSNTLSDNNSVGAAAGKISNAALFLSSNSEYLQVLTNPSIETGDVDFSVCGWFYQTTTGFHTIFSKADLDVDLSLIIHASGPDGGTVFLDSSIPSNKGVFVGSGNVSVKTDQSLFDGRSIFFGSGSFLQRADHPDWNLRGGVSKDFSIDFHVRMATIASGIYGVFEQRVDDSNRWSLAIRTDVNTLLFESRGGSGDITISNSFTWVVDTWYHIALVKTGDKYKMFVDGSQIGSDASNSETIPDLAADIVLGKYRGSAILNAWVEEPRISRFTRWTSNFTKPSKKHDNYGSNLEYHFFVDTDNVPTLLVSHTGTSQDGILKANSFGAVSTATWYNYVVWHDTGNVLGISINTTTSTLAYSNGLKAGSAPLVFGAGSDGSGFFFDGRQDETGFWKRVLTSSERSELYNAGNAVTINPSFDVGPWASFDFGASGIRWYTVAAGTGIYASSDLGANFTNIATDRTATYQSFERSKNILVATSERYDTPLYWPGSGGTFMAILNTSAPLVKYSINFQGFLVLLNSNTRRRGFFYEDENSQLTGDWGDVFDLPSSADDEITDRFILRKKLYVSTRYKIFRISFVGGNPDFSFSDIKDWGFVPRTVKKGFIEGLGEVVVGMSWDRRLRIFDGTDDKIISDPIEFDNKECEFAMDKISFSGSGLIVSNAEYDTNEQIYRLCVAIGENSMNTTHILNFSGRNLAFFPYNNQPWQTMSMVESDNRQFLLATDRSGYIHLLNTSNVDVATPIEDIFESSLLHGASPSERTRGYENHLYFKPSSSNSIYYEDRTDFTDSFKTRHIFNIQNTGGSIVMHKVVDTPVTANAYQFKLSSSSNTAEPWLLTRNDFFVKPLGVGKNR